MRRLLLTTGMLLLSCSACLAQVSTMGSTAMGLPTTPGTIVTSPLNGPGPFSATTQPGTSDTTLAPVPLASDPTTPGTVVTCSTPTGQIAPGTPAVPVTSMSAMGGTMGSMPSAIAPPTISAVPAASSASATGNGIAPYLTLSAQPATSFMTDFPGTTIPAPPLPATPAPPPPSITVPSAPPPSTMSSAVSTSMMGGTPAMPASTTAIRHVPWGPFPRRSSAVRREPYRRRLQSAVHRPLYAVRCREARRPTARPCRCRHRTFRRVHHPVRSSRT